MAIKIKIDQSGKPAGVAGVSREDLDLAVAVTLTATGGVGVTAYRWEIISAAPKDDLTGPSAAVLTSTSTITTQLTPDNRGTYLVELLVDQGYGLGARPDDRDRRTFYAGPTLNADQFQLPRRILADLEELEHNVADLVEPSGNTKGWSREWHRWFRILENLYNSTTIVPAITGPLRALVSNSAGTAAEWVKLTYEYFSPTADIRHTMMQGVGTELLEPSGWPLSGSLNDSSCRIVYQNSGRQFTLSHVADYSFWVAGTRFTKTSDQSIVWPDVAGIHYFYFDGGGVIRTTQVLSTWVSAIGGQGCPIAALQWHTGGAVLGVTDERHGLMPGETHKWAHLGIGALWVSGGALLNFTIGSGSADADAQFGAEQASIRDEDVVGACISNGSQTLTPLVARTWAFVGSQWVHKAADAFPGVLQDGASYTGGTFTGTGRCAYNSIVGGVGSLVEVSANGRYVLGHVFATTEASGYSSDGGSTDWKFAVLLGQHEYTNVTTARDGALIELAGLNLFGFPVEEWVWLGTIIYQTSTAFSNAVAARVVQASDAIGNLVDYLDWRNRLNLPAGASGSTSPTFFSSAFDGIVNSTGGLSKAFFSYNGVAGGSWVSAASNTVLVFDSTGVPVSRTGTAGDVLGVVPTALSGNLNSLEMYRAWDHANAQWLRAANSGGSAFVNLVQVSSSNDVHVGDQAAAAGTDLYLNCASGATVQVYEGATLVAVLADSSQSFIASTNWVKLGGDYVAIDSSGPCATEGAVRNVNGVYHYWRNAANSGNIRGIGVDSNDLVLVGQVVGCGTSSVGFLAKAGTPQAVQTLNQTTVEEAFSSLLTALAGFGLVVDSTPGFAPPLEDVAAAAAVYDFERLQGDRVCATVDPQASAATWVATNCAVTGTGPWTLTNNVGAVAARIADSSIVNVAANGLTIFEVDAAAGVADLMALVSNTAAIEEYFDLSTGTLGTSSSTGIVVSRSISNLGGGVYRCRVMFRPDLNLADLRIYIANTDGSLTSALNDSIVVHRIKGNVQTYWKSVVNKVDQGNAAIQTTASEAPSVIEWAAATPDASVWDGANAGAVFYNGDTALPASSLEADGLVGRFNGVQRPMACYLVLNRIYNAVGSPQMLLSIREGSGNGYMTFFVEDTTLVMSRRVAQASAYFATVATVGTGSWVLVAGYYDNVNSQLRVASAATAGSAVACSPASDVEGELAAVEFNIGGESRAALGYPPSQSAAQIAAAIIVGGPSDVPVTFGNSVDLRIRDWIQKRFSHRSLTV